MKRGLESLISKINLQILIFGRMLANYVGRNDEMSKRGKESLFAFINTNICYFSNKCFLFQVMSTTL